MPEKVILCVDDEKIVLNSLKSQLRKHFGPIYNYEFAQSAKEAWEVIETLAGDNIQILIIISDWLMPYVKGDEFLIDVHHRFPGVVKVMLTGQANAEAISKAQQGANLFSCLHKPWAEEDLVQVVRQGLEDYE